MGAASGFDAMVQTGSAPADWSMGAGLAGAAIDSSNANWNYIKLKFDPIAGVQVYNAQSDNSDLSYDDPTLNYVLVASWSNFSDITQFNQLYLQSPDSASSAVWCITNVEVYASLQPSSGKTETAPVFSVPGGTYWTPQSVVITAPAGATIHYTTDGSAPSATNGTAITSGSSVTVNQTTILAAVALASGDNPSTVTTANYLFPVLTGLTQIPYVDNVTMDGNLNEAPWSTATWSPLNQVYYSDYGVAIWPDDITTAYWAAVWGAQGSQLYVAVKVLDSQWVFTDTYDNWNVRDGVELYVHTTGTEPEGAYNTDEGAAQQYTIGVMNSNHSQCWTAIVDGLPIPASAGFQAATTVDPATGLICYEAAITPFQFFGGLDSPAQPNVVSTLYPGDVIGLDVAVADMDDSGNFTMLSDFTDIGTSIPYYMSNDYYNIPARLLTVGTVSIGQAKNTAANSLVGVSGIVSAAFANCFYVESSDRMWGIRVNMANNNQVVGTIVNVTGQTETMSSGELSIAASSVVAAGSGVVEPLEITNKALGGGAFELQPGIYGAIGLSNIGLLVKTTGTVTGKDTSDPTPQWFTINDGSGVSVTVYGTVPSGTPVRECYRRKFL